MIEIKGLETYFGGKGASGTYQTIINHIPECDIFVSGFLGADFIIRNMKCLPGRTVGIDVDTRLIALWEAAAGNIGIDVIAGKFLDVLPTLNLSDYKKPFIYLDPPYPHSTRTSNHRYKYDMTDKEHIELLSAVRNIKCNVAISTYDNDIYKELLNGWYKIHFESKIRKGVRIETLYMNYDISLLPLQDMTYTGTNYRERDRIRQKCKRWKNRINRMSKEERDYLFTELKKFYEGLPAGNVTNDVAGSETSADNIVFDVTGLHGQYR
jgi:DNA adenine methylase